MTDPKSYVLGDFRFHDLNGDGRFCPNIGEE